MTAYRHMFSLQTSSTYEMVQKDLSEFYQTIQTDTAHVVVDTASKVQDQIQVCGIQMFFHSLVMLIL